MIILDTHVWIWLVNSDAKLTADYKKAIADNESNGLGVSAISLWETAKLIERGRQVLSLPIEDWLT